MAVIAQSFINIIVELFDFLSSLSSFYLMYLLVISTWLLFCEIIFNFLVAFGIHTRFVFLGVICSQLSSGTFAFIIENVSSFCCGNEE